MTYQTNEVQSSGTFLRTFAAGKNGLVFVELALFDRHINSHDILPHNAASTNVQMSFTRVVQHQDKGEMVREDLPNLRVAHQTFAETNRGATGQECDSSMFIGNLVHVGGVSCLDGIALGAFLRRNTPTIVDAAQESQSVNQKKTSKNETNMRQTLFLILAGMVVVAREKKEQGSAKYFSSDIATGYIGKVPNGFDPILLSTGAYLLVQGSKVKARQIKSDVL
jgi:hypothetical protein